MDLPSLPRSRSSCLPSLGRARPPYWPIRRRPPAALAEATDDERAWTLATAGLTELAADHLDLLAREGVPNALGAADGRERSTHVRVIDTVLGVEQQCDRSA